MTALRNLGVLFIGAYALWLMRQAYTGAPTGLDDGGWMIPAAVCIVVIILTLMAAQQPGRRYRRRRK